MSHHRAAEQARSDLAGLIMEIKPIDLDALEEPGMLNGLDRERI